MVFPRDLFGCPTLPETLCGEELPSFPEAFKGEEYPTFLGTPLIRQFLTHP